MIPQAIQTISGDITDGGLERQLTRSVLVGQLGTSEGNSIKALDGGRHALEKIRCFSNVSST